MGGHGIWRPGERINRCIEVTRGHLCSKQEYDHSEDENERNRLEEPDRMGRKIAKVSLFQPVEELCVSCKTVVGQSGGPCVNQRGEVIGILCRGYGDKSYLIPSRLLEGLVEEAKKPNSIALHML